MHVGMTVDFIYMGNVFNGEIIKMLEGAGETTLWIESEDLLEPAEVDKHDIIKIYRGSYAD